MLQNISISNKNIFFYFINYSSKNLGEKNMMVSTKTLGSTTLFNIGNNDNGIFFSIKSAY